MYILHYQQHLEQNKAITCLPVAEPRLDAVIDRTGGGVIGLECIFNVHIEFCYIHCGIFHENAIASVLTVSVNAIKKNNI